MQISACFRTTTLAGAESADAVTLSARFKILPTIRRGTFEAATSSLTSLNLLCVFAQAHTITFRPNPSIFASRATLTSRHHTGQDSQTTSYRGERSNFLVYAYTATARTHQTLNIRRAHRSRLDLARLRCDPRLNQATFAQALPLLSTALLALEAPIAFSLRHP